MLTVIVTALIGLYAGSLLTEAVILVPYWRKVPADDFFRLHEQLGPQLFRFFAPLTTLTVVSSVVAAIGGNTWNIIAAALCCTALVIFFLYFKKANASFADHSLDAKDLSAELARWNAWHWTRTIIVIGAFVSSIYAGQ